MKIAWRHASLAFEKLKVPLLAKGHNNEPRCRILAVWKLELV